MKENLESGTGPNLPFVEWAHIVVDDVRRRVLSAVAARKGSSVIIRDHGREVTLKADGGTYWVTFSASVAALFVSDRRDAFTARNVAKTIAGHLDPEQSRPDK